MGTRNATIEMKPTRRHARRWLATLLVAFAAISFGSSAQATMYCAATVAGGSDANDDGLAKALSDLASGPEGGTYDIRLRYGTFQLGSITINFDKDKDNKTVKVSGGWNSTCGERTGKPADSVIKGAAPSANSFGTDFGLYGDNARYDFQNLRFENFGYFSIDDKTCTFTSASLFCPDTQAIYIDHVEFYNGGQISITSNDATKVVFRSNLVAKIRAYDPQPSDLPPVTFNINNDEDAPDISFNTFADIECGGGPGGVYIRSSQAHVALHHNIMQTTGCMKDLYIDPSDGGKTVTPYYNLLLGAGGLVGGNLVDNGNVLNFNPQFVDAFNGDYRLQQDTSPAVNKGATLIGAIQSGFVVPAVDLDGKNRPLGTRFDIGAYESNKIDGVVPVITVNSADDADDGLCDATHCSLREAINLANSQPNSAQRIKFNIDGSCPQVILLDSPLPDITDSVWINGSTQPGSAQNTLDLGSDAQVCLIIGPGAAMSHAIGVPLSADASVKLTLDGVAFGNNFFGFSTAPVELRSGSGHKISGSVFGGRMPPANNIDEAGSLGRAIYVAGTAKQVTIGGPANADRNYFGALGDNGIVFNNALSTDDLIQNNYIGVQPNGLAAQGNSADGISISGATNMTIMDNAICASNNGIDLIGADTTGVTIQRNNIGVNAAGYGVAAHANNIGINVGLGSSGHTIGFAPADYAPPGTYSNYISNNNGDGIRMESNLGSGNTISGYNSIRGNLIEGNARSGTGIGIDLGASETTLENDDGDADVGANTLQNHPLIRGGKPSGAFGLDLNTVLNTAPNRLVRVDVYYSQTCEAAKGANATFLLGSKDVNSGASGIVNFTTTVANPAFPGYLTATATTDVGQTSELAPCVRSDTIFRDGLQKAGL